MKKIIWTWPNAARGYIQHLRAAGRAKGTIRIHSYYVGKMAGLSPCPAHLTTRRLEAWLATGNWAPETLRSAQSVARGFCTWATREGLYKTNPAEGLSPITIPLGIPRPAPDSAITAALYAADPRSRLLIRLGALAGLRACEICKVKGKDFDGQTLRVTGKGGKTRLVPIVDQELIEALGSCPGFLFPGLTEGHLSAGHVSKLLARALPDGYTGHQLRHRFGTVAYRKTKDVLSVATLMGHAKTDTTRRYVALDTDQLMATVSAVGF